MKITVKDPATGQMIVLEAKPERYHNEQGYRIIYSNGSHFFISNKFGTWRPADDHHLEPDLLIQIGLAIEGWQEG